MGENELEIDGNRMKSGKVKRTFPDRGYLWIEGEDGVDYFGHASQIQDGVLILDLWIGRRCSFLPSEGEKGPVAEHIKVA